MAEKRTTPEAPQNAQNDASPGARRKKRAAPTIDLTATEVPPATGRIRRLHQDKSLRRLRQNPAPRPRI